MKILVTKHNAQQNPFSPRSPEMTQCRLPGYGHRAQGQRPEPHTDSTGNLCRSYFWLGRLLAVLGSAIISATLFKQHKQADTTF